LITLFLDLVFTVSEPVSVESAEGLCFDLVPESDLGLLVDMLSNLKGLNM